MKTKRDMCETPGEGKRDEKIWLHQTIYIYIYIRYFRIYIYIFDIFEYIYIYERDALVKNSAFIFREEAFEEEKRNLN